MTKPLTDKEIKSAKPRDKEYTLSDGQGLQLRIMPNGKTKSWRFVYKSPKSDKQAKMSLGTYPNLSLAHARQKAQDARELIAQGIDPKDHRDHERQRAKDSAAASLINVASEWMNGKRATVTPDYAHDVWRKLEIHVFPEHQNTPISEITAPTMIESLKRVQAKGSLETVRMFCQLLNEIMTYAVNCGMLHANSLSGIKAAFLKPKKEHMPTLRPDALPDFLKVLSLANLKTTTRCLIHFQLHTMTRPSEAAGARWDEIDTESKLWTIPAERMKKRKAHVIPLTEQVLEILERMSPISGHREFVFPSDRDPSKPTNSQTANAAIKRMGYGGKLVSHGLRSIASTALNEHGFESDHIEAALAHGLKDGVRSAYNRANYIEQRRNMMNWWSIFIESKV